MNRPVNYQVKPLQPEHAEDILHWRYPEPYDFYDPPDDGNTDFYVSEFIKPELQFHVILDDSNEMVGFCSYGLDGQVPGGNYSFPALDIGLGMKPEFTGRGLGRGFFNAILKYGRDNFQTNQFRLTVANFNQRAMCLYKRVGFRPASEFTDSRNQIEYTILISNIIAPPH